MKKVFFSLSFMLISLFAFANSIDVNKIKLPITKSEEKVTVRMTYYRVYCNGVLTGFFACDGCNVKAVANAICNG